MAEELHCSMVVENIEVVQWSKDFCVGNMPPTLGEGDIPVSS